MAAIVTESLTKFYGRQRGIEDLNLEVREGEIFGFLGPNGAGKTTTIRLLLDLIRPTRGRAAVFGLDARKDTIAVRRRVGYLPGEPGLYDHLTGEEYLAYLASFRKGVDPARRRELAGRLDIDLRRRIRTLSHGMKQKVAIIQAFMHGADLLVLDEPTSGLDPLMQHVFYELLEEEKASGRTVFMSSHILSEVERVCDRVAIIRGGKIALVEDVATLTQKRVKKVHATLGGGEAAGGLKAASSSLTRPGVRELAVKGQTVTFRVETSTLPDIVKVLSGLPLVDLTIENPSLEDIFFEYFGPEAAAEVARAHAEGGGDGAGTGRRSPWWSLGWGRGGAAK